VARRSPGPADSHTIEYDLEATYEGFYRHIVRQIEALNLARCSLESYKRARQEQDDFDLGRQVALVGTFKSRFLKPLESSTAAFRISIRRALELERRDTKGMYFYFTAPRDSGRAHFWRSYDLGTRKIVDNRYPIMQMTACRPDTPRFPPPYYEIDVFEIQDKGIASILRHVEQQATAAIVHKPVAEEQASVSQVLQGHPHNSAFERREPRELRNFLKQPLVGASVQELRKALQIYSNTNDVHVLIEAV
jgi:hypothetical protein